MRRLARAAIGVCLVALLSTPAAAHGLTAAATGLAFPIVVASVVAVSLLGGGLVFGAHGRLSWPPSRSLVPILVVALGAAALSLAVTRAMAVAILGTAVGVGAVYVGRGASVTDCGTCADATLGAVTLHRGLEGIVLATVYAADAALGLAGAGVLAVHAMAETAAVGSLYAPAGRRYALLAVCLVQAGFVLGVAAGWRVVDGVPPAAQAALLALVGGILVAVGTREARRRHVVSVGVPA